MVKDAEACAEDGLIVHGISQAEARIEVTLLRNLQLIAGSIEAGDADPAFEVGNGRNLCGDRAWSLCIEIVQQIVLLDVAGLIAVAETVGRGQPGRQLPGVLCIQAIVVVDRLRLRLIARGDGSEAEKQLRHARSGVGRRSRSCAVGTVGEFGSSADGELFRIP